MDKTWWRTGRILLVVMLVTGPGGAWGMDTASFEVPGVTFHADGEAFREWLADVSGVPIPRDSELFLDGYRLLLDSSDFSGMVSPGADDAPVVVVDWQFDGAASVRGVSVFSGDEEIASLVARPATRTELGNLWSTERVDMLLEQAVRGAEDPLAACIAALRGTGLSCDFGELYTGERIVTGADEADRFSRVLTSYALARYYLTISPNPRSYEIAAVHLERVLRSTTPSVHLLEVYGEVLARIGGDDRPVRAGMLLLDMEDPRQIVPGYPDPAAVGLRLDPISVSYDFARDQTYRGIGFDVVEEFSGDLLRFCRPEGRNAGIIHRNLAVVALSLGDPRADDHLNVLRQDHPDLYRSWRAAHLREMKARLQVSTSPSTLQSAVGDELSAYLESRALELD